MPLPVCPYARMVPLYPFSTDETMCLQSSNTSAWLTSSPARQITAWHGTGLQAETHVCAPQFRLSKAPAAAAAETVVGCRPVLCTLLLPASAVGMTYRQLLLLTNCTGCTTTFKGQLCQQGQQREIMQGCTLYAAKGLCVVHFGACMLFCCCCCTYCHLVNDVASASCHCSSCTTVFTIKNTTLLTIHLVVAIGVGAAVWVLEEQVHLLVPISADAPYSRLLL